MNQRSSNLVFWVYQTNCVLASDTRKYLTLLGDMLLIVTKGLITKTFYPAPFNIYQLDKLKVVKIQCYLASCPPRGGYSL